MSGLNYYVLFGKLLRRNWFYFSCVVVYQVRPILVLALSTTVYT